MVHHIATHHLGLDNDIGWRPLRWQSLDDLQAEEKVEPIGAGVASGS